jgi:hypothetical protein
MQQRRILSKLSFLYQRLIARPRLSYPLFAERYLSRQSYAEHFTILVLYVVKALASYTTIHYIVAKK